MKHLESTWDFVQSSGFPSQSVPSPGASLEARQELPIARKVLHYSARRINDVSDRNLYSLFIMNPAGVAYTIDCRSHIGNRKCPCLHNLQPL